MKLLYILGGLMLFGFIVDVMGCNEDTEESAAEREKRNREVMQDIHNRYLASCPNGYIRRGGGAWWVGNPGWDLHRRVPSHRERVLESEYDRGAIGKLNCL